MRVLILFAFTIIGSSIAGPVTDDSDITFDQWEIKFNKKLEASRRSFYKANFDENVKLIKQFNNNGEKNSYRIGLNEFSHLPHDDFVATRCKTKRPDDFKFDQGLDDLVGAAITTPPSSKYPFYSYTIYNVPPEVDWRGLMQPIQNQGSCGACWAFATMGQMEAMLRIRDPTYPDYTFLSPQYVIDCDTSEQGCEGGWPATALRYLRSATNGNNAPKMTDYPYALQRQVCNPTVTKVPLNIVNVVERYVNGNETGLQVQITNYGPVIGSMYATRNLVPYSNGVFVDPSCVNLPACSDKTAVNHAVVIVGFGTDAQFGDYWLVRNSWGTSWGENGYFRIARNKNNHCNIACYAMLGY